jgi:hypothetical protein
MRGLKLVFHKINVVKHMALAGRSSPTTAEVSPLPVWQNVFRKDSPHACNDSIDT